MARDRITIGSTTEELNDARLPASLGTAGQSLKMNSLANAIVWYDPEQHFIGTYEVTTFAEFTTAIAAGKICYVKLTEGNYTYIYQLTRSKSTKYYFTAFYDGIYSGQLTVDSDDEWDMDSYAFAVASHLHDDRYYTETEVDSALALKLNTSLKGAASGLAELDANGLVPATQLPSYVDDVLEYANRTAFPTTGETGKIYVAKDTNLTYRWGGTDYVEISASLALGTTSSTAYRGDYGNTAYTHSQATGNPHATTYAQLTGQPTALSDFTDDLGSSPTHTHSQYLVAADIANKEEKGYLTMQGTSYPIRVSTTDSGVAGYITFVIQS